MRTRSRNKDAAAFDTLFQRILLQDNTQLFGQKNLPYFSLAVYYCLSAFYGLKCYKFNFRYPKSCACNRLYQIIQLFVFPVLLPPSAVFHTLFLSVPLTCLQKSCAVFSMFLPSFCANRHIQRTY